MMNKKELNVEEMNQVNGGLIVPFEKSYEIANCEETDTANLQVADDQRRDNLASYM